MTVYDVNKPYGRNIHIDRGGGCLPRYIIPPPLRLYNPSRIIAPSKCDVVQRFEFWNPFTSENVLRAAYGSLRRRSPVSDIGIDVRGRQVDSWPDEDVRHHEDDFNPFRWFFNESPLGGDRKRYLSKDRWFNEYDDFTDYPLRDLWSLFMPSRWTRMIPWSADDIGHDYGSFSKDVHNYRIAKNINQRSLSSHATDADNCSHLHSNNRPSWSSAAGVSRHSKDDFYRVRFRLPGVNEDDIKIRINNGVLTVDSKSNTVKRDEERDSSVSYSQAFHHSVTLPSDVLERRAKARFADGTLTVSIPYRS